MAPIRFAELGLRRSTKVIPAIGEIREEEADGNADELRHELKSKMEETQ